MSSVALFGGSFDPPHVGHVLAATWVLSTRGVDAVRVVPTYDHAFDKRLTAFEHRLSMVELAFAPLAGVQISDVERALGGQSFTIRTVRHFLREAPETGLRLMVGTDLVEQLPAWREGDALIELAPPLVVGRGGHAAGGEEIVIPDVSSTEVRRRVAAGEPIDHLVPSAVVDYIARHQLYG